MIYLVEIPLQMPPKVWFGSTQTEIMSVIDEVSAKSGDNIYEETTGRDLLEMFGYDSTAEMREDNDELGYIADLIDSHGLDATLYRGYNEDYTSEPVDRWESYLEWNGHDLSAQLVYMSTKEAREALNNDAEWRRKHQGIKARIALEKVLEVIR